MSELPVITYTDSEGQVFNFMSDLDNVRDEDTEIILVPRTTPEEPLDVDLDIIDSEISDYNDKKMLTTTFSYAPVNDLWNKSDKTLNGTLAYTSGGSLNFSLPLEQDAKFDIPGTEQEAIDESVDDWENANRHSFTHVSELKYYEHSETIDDRIIKTEGWRIEYELDDEYYYGQYDIVSSYNLRLFPPPPGWVTTVSISPDSVDNLEEYIGWSQTLNIGETYSQLNINDKITLSITNVAIIGNRAVIDYTLETDFDAEESLTITKNFSLWGLIVSVYDDGEHSYLRYYYQVYREDREISGNIIRGYKDYYSSEYIFIVNGQETRVSDAIGASTEISNGNITITKITKIDRSFLTLDGLVYVVNIEVMAIAPTGYHPDSSEFHYTYPAQSESVYIEYITDDASSMATTTNISFPSSEDFTVENVSLHVHYDYPDDTIYLKNLYCGRIIDGSFHEFEWDKSVSERQFGETVNGWTKSSKEYKATLLFSGTDEQKRLALNRFHSSIENDIMHETPGTLRWDDATIDCYIRGSSTKPSDKFNDYTENEITIYCPRPFWEHEITQQFYSGINNSESDTTYVKNWPHDYSGYDYLFINDRESYILNDGPLSEWQIIINGPARKPIIHIGNNIIAMNTEIPVNSYLMIDSRDKIIYLVNPDGSMDNRFGERDLENYIFEKIEPGYSKVTWNGSYEWLLTLYEERSEPRWPY